MSSPAFRYTKHYSLEEARELLPQVQKWLEEIHTLSQKQETYRDWQEAMFEEGHDLGGPDIDGELGNLHRMLQVLQEFRNREILIKDLSRGLVDFPSIMGGREVYLCWEKGQSDIIYWEELDMEHAG